MIWHLFSNSIDVSLAKLRHYMQTYGLPWMVFAPLLDIWLLFLGVDGDNVLVFDPRANGTHEGFTMEECINLSTWLPLESQATVWGDAVTSAQAFMLLPQEVESMDEGKLDDIFMCICICLCVS